VTWIIDTCIVLDVFENDPQFGEKSVRLLEKLAPEGLAVGPVTMVELAAAFAGDLDEQKNFLNQTGISYAEAWSAADTESAHAAWNHYVGARRTLRVAKWPVADLLIGGFATNRRGLVTRNPDDFRRWFPNLAIRVP